jgi:hypothetical protein
MNPHIPSGFPLWELESLWSIEFSNSDFKGHNSLKSYLYHWKVLETLISEMGLHDAFEYL